MAQNRAITTCSLTLLTIGCHNKQQVESSPDTMSTLSSTNSTVDQDYLSLLGESTLEPSTSTSEQLIP